MHRRLTIKILAALTAFGAVFAMAATMTVSSGSLGAGNTTVAACDTTGVKASYPSPTFNDSTDVYEIGSVTVQEIMNACSGKTVKVTLLTSSGTKLGEGSATVPAAALIDDTLSATVSLGPAAAASVERVHVVIAD